MPQKDPAFLFYSEKFLVGTALMKDVYVGKYIRVLCTMHQAGGTLTKGDIIKVCGGVFPQVFKKFTYDKATETYHHTTLKEVMDEREAKISKNRTSANVRWDQERADKSSSTQNTEDIPPDTKDETQIFKPPALEEVIKYFTDNGFSKELAERAWKGYDVANWKDSNGKKIKNWKQKMHQVWFRNENKFNGVKKGTHPGQIMHSGNIKPEWRKDDESD